MQRSGMLVRSVLTPKRYLTGAWLQPPSTKFGSKWTRKARFVIKVYFSEFHFIIHIGAPIGDIVSTMNCYSQMFSTLSGTRTRNIDPLSGSRSFPDL